MSSLESHGNLGGSLTSNHSDAWVKRLGEVFDTRPRVSADEDDKRWIKRDEEATLRTSLVCPGVHVCLFGPSGSGKTSIAKTILFRLKRRGIRHIYVRISHSTNWESFKSQIIDNKQSKSDLDHGAGIKLGLKNLIPYIELSQEGSDGNLRDAPARAEIVAALHLNYLANVLVSENIVLVVDDVNFCNDNLLQHLTDLAKEITDNSPNSAAKILFIGADDVFIRIIQTEPSLKDRMDEISVGAIEDEKAVRGQIKRDRVWRFISDGLVQLGFIAPERDVYISKDELVSCKEAIEYAADGLPKSIVKLGRLIAEEGGVKPKPCFCGRYNKIGKSHDEK